MAELALELAGRPGGGGGIVDSKGVGQPPKLSGEDESEFAEWSHNVMVFLSVQFGPGFARVLRWGGMQRKRIAAATGPEGPGCRGELRE